MEPFQSFVGRDPRRLYLRSRSSFFLAGLICVWLVGGLARTKAAEPASTLVLDPAIEQKIDSLLQQMTVEEKVGQLNQFNGDYTRTGPVPQDAYHQAKYSKLKSGEVGSFLNVVGASQTRTVQQMAIEGSRFKIPLLFGLDVIHGFKTIFPIPLGEAASWDLEAIERSARIAAREASSAGVHWTFAPMVDIARDPRWGRVMEGAGEDPYLGSLIAAARVRGFQGPKLGEPGTIMACAKHYAAYGAVEGGRDYNTVDMSYRRLREIYLPPFHAAVEAGAATVMNAFNVFDGMPASGNKFLVHDVLKGEWGFRGFVVSDWGSFGEMIVHGVARDKAEAARLAITAGSDMDMEATVYLEALGGLVKDGVVPMSALDEAVRRVLRLKFVMGLFDDPFRYCDEQKEKATLLNPQHLAAARDMGRKSIVLLKNEGNILPLKKDVRTLAVIGPLADSKRDMIGGWNAAGEAKDAVTLLEGIKAKVGSNTQVVTARGCGDHGRCPDGQIQEAANAARQADVIILAIGENWDMSGEAQSRAYLDLPGRQMELVRAVMNLKLPTVVVLMNGRPLVLNELSEKAPALLEAWFLGTQAGNAIADVLFGDYNPSGKLPISFPYAVGQIPVYYSHMNTGRPYTPGGPKMFVSTYSDIPNDPLYPFGYGLSYTSFKYSDLTLSKEKVRIGEPLEVRVRVANTGSREGAEIVQLYVRDWVASVVRPVKQLQGFRKLELKAGETREVAFTLTSDDLKFYDGEMKYTVEPGEFSVFVGGNSRDVLEKRFVLEGQ
jgi:beta-glucosidase